MNMQFTRPMGFVTRVGGQPIRRGPASMQTRSSGETYWLERRRVELAAERRANPDAALFGLAVPFDVPLPDGRGNRIEFRSTTRWQHDALVPIELEHGGELLGVGSVLEERDGLHLVDATLCAASRQRLGDRRHLSVGLGEYLTHRRADGVLVVDDAELREISVVRVPRWPEHCAAHVVQKASA